MGNELQKTEPRSRFIIRRTLEILRRNSLSVRKFATRVALGYLSRTAEHERAVLFYQGEGSTDSAFRAEKKNAQRVLRFLDGIVKFPADLEEAWVLDGLADLEDDRRTLLRELAERCGLSGVRASTQGAPEYAANMGDVLRDAGDICRAFAPALADGQITPDDRPHLIACARSIDKAVDDLVTMRVQIRQHLEGEASRPLTLSRAKG